MTVPMTVLNDAVDRAIEDGPELLRDAFRQLSNDELTALYYQLTEIREEASTVLMERGEEVLRW
jgi:hypothetical protein